MSKQTPIESTCAETCRLSKHGDTITSIITKSTISDFKLACFLQYFCKNNAHVLDSEKRSALHTAASCGRRDLCLWLIKNGKADRNLKDYESGYTPLHRSIFYGHINIAVSLIEAGAQINSLDKDDLCPSEHLMKDRLFKDFSSQNLCQVYVWGTNNNYTLGTGSQKSQNTPELLDFFRKSNTSVKQVITDKFHTVFVSTNGRAWACGHGQGGRLGLEGEQTVLTPQLLKTGGETVTHASVARDHTILLMENGTVWSCGCNTHHVLGHVPPPPVLFSPRPIHVRQLKAAQGPIVNVAAARYHSVIWCNNTVLTFGLNGGQLGHPLLQEKTIITPKQVPGVNLSGNCGIVDVATSVGASVIATTKGDIYLLYNYQVKRIPVASNSKSNKSADKILDVVKVSVFGGTLNAEVNGKLSEKGGEELRVMVLTSTGKLLLWTESFPQLTRVFHSSKRSLSFCGISLSLTNMLLITKDGEAFIGRIKPKSKRKSTMAQSPKAESNVSNRKDEGLSFNQFIDRLDCHHMTLTRVPHVHRAVNVAMDPTGQNFFTVQEHPKVNLIDIPLIDESEFPQQMAAILRDAHEDDTLHDILIELDKQSVPAHHFVLAQASEEFAQLSRQGSCTHYRLKGVDVQVLNQVLSFAYTHDCAVIHPGPLDSQLQNFKGDIIKATLDLARRFKMPLLIKCLQLLRLDDGLVVFREVEGPSLRHILGVRPRFARSASSSLYDVTIRSSDSAAFKAHKCVLAARLDYFNSMFTGGWIEADTTSNLSLPIPQTILKEVLDMLYSDEAPLLMDSQDTDYISRVLVVADQLFIKRLKQFCEVALTSTLSLRNAAYLLQLAITYNADQLKNCCMQFICLNLSAILETRILEILDDKTLEDLSKYYKQMTLSMDKRIITPYTSEVTEEDINEIAELYPIPWNNSRGDSADLESPNMNVSNSTQNSRKKKFVRNRRSSESQRKRSETVSSSSDLDLSLDAASDDRIDFEELEEISPSKVESWITVDKTQKSVQNRLKGILAGSKIEPTPENFTPLTPASQTGSSHVSSQDSEEFPDLSQQHKFSSSPRTCFIEVKHVLAVKMSQKQRKRLLLEKSEEVEVLPMSPPRSAWAPVPSVDCSLTDLINSPLSVGSPPSSDQGQVRFADIMADEIQQRDNWSKMKSKSLHLTQIEDKAMEELEVFYNAANVFDERITVERVLSTNVAKPMWITTKHL